MTTHLRPYYILTHVTGATCWSFGFLPTKHWNVFTSYRRTENKHQHVTLAS